MYAAIKAIEYYLPDKIVTNEELAAEFPDWGIDKIKAKTGISTRHIAADDECASDLAYKAAEKLFLSRVCQPADINFLLLCTQSPDYFLPTTACILQDRLGIPTTAGALDFNLGCSGYIYGLALAKGLIETGQAKNILLITAETYSKYLEREDKTVRTIFGDGAAATLLVATTSDKPLLESVVFGTDGGGKDKLIVAGGGLRAATASKILYMDGPEIFVFTVKVIPQLVTKLLAAADRTINDIDFFIFHQANKYMLDFLRDKIQIPKEKFYMYMENVGNTVSSTIPIALHHAIAENKISRGSLVMLVGFGVGYSYAGMIVRVC